MLCTEKPWEKLNRLQSSNQVPTPYFILLVNILKNSSYLPRRMKLSRRSTTKLYNPQRFDTPRHEWQIKMLDLLQNIFFMLSQRSSLTLSSSSTSALLYWSRIPAYYIKCTCTQNTMEFKRKEQRKSLHLNNEFYLFIVATKNTVHLYLSSI